MEDNVNTVLDAITTYRRTLTKRAIPVRFGISRVTSPDDWLHVKREIIT